jgi:hemin uptake protein HemP
MAAEMSEEPPRDEPDDEPVPTTDGPVLLTEELFGDNRQVWIDHNGERYRLRITRRGKLILQK